MASLDIYVSDSGLVSITYKELKRTKHKQNKQFN